MKITFEIPDETIALSLTGVWLRANGQMLGTHMVETAEIKDGAEIVCDWKGGVADED